MKHLWAIWLRMRYSNHWAPYTLKMLHLFACRWQDKIIKSLKYWNRCNEDVFWVLTAVGWPESETKSITKKVLTAHILFTVGLMWRKERKEKLGGENLFVRVGSWFHSSLIDTCVWCLSTTAVASTFSVEYCMKTGPKAIQTVNKSNDDFFAFFFSL